MPNDDDLALKEGRSMVLIETWINMTKGVRKLQTRRVREEFEITRMKLRFSMKKDAFIQLVKVVNFNEMDLVVMRSMGMLRDPGGDVKIYLSEEQLRNECMKRLLKQADVIHGLSKSSIFLTKDTMTAGLVVGYDPHMTMLEVKNRAADFYNPQSHTIRLERLNGEVLCGRTLQKCNVKPGDCIRVVE